MTGKLSIIVFCNYWLLFMIYLHVDLSWVKELLQSWMTVWIFFWIRRQLLLLSRMCVTTFSTKILIMVFPIGCNMAAIDWVFAPTSQATNIRSVLVYNRREICFHWQTRQERRDLIPVSIALVRPSHTPGFLANRRFGKRSKPFRSNGTITEQNWMKRRRDFQRPSADGRSLKKVMKSWIRAWRKLRRRSGWLALDQVLKRKDL